MTNTSPEVLTQQAVSAYHQKEYKQAAALFLQAADGYGENQNPLMAAEMHNNCSVALLQAGEDSAALQAVGNTDVLFAQAGDVKRQAMAMGNKAAALEALGKLKEALDCYNQSSTLLNSLGENEMNSLVLKRISSLQLRSGKALESLANMDAALALEKPKTLKEKLLRKLFSFTRRV